MNLNQFEGHTPGPWARQYRETIFTIAGGGDEFGGANLIATINHDVDERLGENNASARSDAMLIEAAPDLLEYARQLERERDELKDGLEKARALLAKGEK